MWAWGHTTHHTSHHTPHITHHTSHTTHHTSHTTHHTSHTTHHTPHITHHTLSTHKSPSLPLCLSRSSIATNCRSHQHLSNLLPYLLQHYYQSSPVKHLPVTTKWHSCRNSTWQGELGESVVYGCLLWTEWWHVGLHGRQGVDWLNGWLAEKL
jgi:hypothetical protein